MKAIVRDIPNSYPKLYFPKEINIDLNLAKKQHQGYIKALQWLGLKVDILPADEEFPDCVFIEDTAIIHKNKALINRTGSNYRRGEEKPIEEYFKKTHEIIKMDESAFLEGGDVLKTENKVYVGISKVTNSLSLKYVKQIFDNGIIPIPVTKTLHLKTACSYIGNNTLLICDSLISREFFKNIKLIPIPKDESYAANCIAINNRIIVPSQAKKTISILKKKKDLK